MRLTPRTAREAPRPRATLLPPRPAPSRPPGLAADGGGARREPTLSDLSTDAFRWQAPRDLNLGSPDVDREAPGTPPLLRWPVQRAWLVGAGAALVLALCSAWLVRPAATPVESTSDVELAPAWESEELRRALLEKTGLWIDSAPSGAAVELDGRATGLTTPARIVGLTPGLHAVVLELQGYVDTALPATVNEGAILVLPPVQLHRREPGATASNEVRMAARAAE